MDVNLTKKELKTIYDFSRDNSFKETCNKFLKDVSDYYGSVLYSMSFSTRDDYWHRYEIISEDDEKIVLKDNFYTYIYIGKHGEYEVKLDDFRITTLRDPYEISKFVNCSDIGSCSILEYGIETYREKHKDSSEEDTETEEEEESETELKKIKNEEE